MNAPFLLPGCELIESDATAALEQLAASSVDMVYCDPPFGNEQIWTGRRGQFSDKWKPAEASINGWRHLRAHTPAAEVVELACSDGKQRAYLGVIAGIVLGVHRVLRPTGTLWLHFDDTMGAHLRLLCDVIFGPDMALGTLVWKRMSGGKNTKRGFGRVHDTIACYGRSRAARWRLWRLGTIGGDPLDPNWCWRFDDFASAEPLNSFDSERAGYPTQKPIALLEELIRAATLPGDLILDPTCGSGTTVVAAAKNSRRAIGIDLSPDAIRLARERLSIPASDDVSSHGARRRRSCSGSC